MITSSAFTPVPLFPLLLVITINLHTVSRAAFPRHYYLSETGFLGYYKTIFYRCTFSCLWSVHFVACIYSGCKYTALYRCIVKLCMYRSCSCFKLKACLFYKENLMALLPLHTKNRMSSYVMYEQ